MTNYNHCHNVLRLFEIFLPQVVSVVIDNTNGIYELPHDLPNYLRLWIL